MQTYFPLYSKIAGLKNPNISFHSTQSKHETHWHKLSVSATGANFTSGMLSQALQMIHTHTNAIGQVPCTK